jgi:hypothetical protein
MTSLCGTCGRPRSGTGRFCGGCGAEFSEPAPDQDNQEPPAGNATHPSPAADATRVDVDPGVSHAEHQAGRPDPFASWYQQEAPARNQDASTPGWQPTQTVGATPSYPPPAPPPVFPPGPPTAPPGRENRGRGLFIAVAVVVVLAAGGGAYALAASLGKHSSAQPPPATPTPTPSASTSAAATTQPATSPATSASSTPTPSPTLSLVAISPSVPSSAAEPQVETLLSHYFHGINTHSYPEYSSTLNSAQLASQSQSKFESGYSSTTDSAMTLTGLSDNGNGGLVATVTFTSHQSPSDSVDHSSCNAWTLNFYLVQQGSGYLIGPAPSGYQPTYSDC